MQTSRRSWTAFLPPPAPSKSQDVCMYDLRAPADCLVSYFILLLQGLLFRRAQHGGTSCEKQHARRSSASLQGVTFGRRLHVTANYRCTKRGPVSRGGGACLTFFVTSVYIWRRRVF